MKTEKEKMLAGELYNAADPQLAAERRRARELCYALNHSQEAETELRAKLLKDLLGSLGEGVWIEPPFYCDYGANITLGSKVFFNFNCVILDVMPVIIGDNVFCGPGVQIYTATHPINAAERRTWLEYAKPITIGSDVWIGGGAILCPGVKVGAGSVIGAGSVVTKDVPPGCLVAGNPARTIRQIPA